MPSQRWLIAQGHQLDYQRQKLPAIKRWPEFSEGFRRWARDCERSLAEVASLGPGSRILEVGSGPTGLIFHMGIGTRFALDPLAHEYRQVFAEAQGTGVRILAGMGESLPLSDRSMDAVILYNTLDHTDDPSSVLREIYRVLKEDGVLYCEVNIYPPALWAAGRVYEAVSFLTVKALSVLLPPSILRSHPHMFTLGSIGRLLAGKGYKIVRESATKSREAKRMFRLRRTGWVWRLISVAAYTGRSYHAFCKIGVSS